MRASSIRGTVPSDASTDPHPTFDEESIFGKCLAVVRVQPRRIMMEAIDRRAEYLSIRHPIEASAAPTKTSAAADARRSSGRDDRAVWGAWKSTA
jgi:ABC-type Fe2+-enterobactin transport system substrate-binding protein